jgi:ATP-dependent HslUV protease ATP-binding subunit HslU
MERVFEELSFTAPDRGGEKVVVDAKFVDDNLGEMARATDTQKYML